jgi:hypothetical protein
VLGGGSPIADQEPGEPVPDSGGAEPSESADAPPPPRPTPTAREIAERLVSLTYAQQVLGELRQARERLGLVQSVPDDELRGELLRELTAFGNTALEVIARLRE